MPWYRRCVIVSESCCWDTSDEYDVLKYESKWIYDTKTRLPSACHQQPLLQEGSDIWAAPVARASRRDVVAQSQFHLSALQHVLIDRPPANQPYHMDIPVGRGQPASMNLIIHYQVKCANEVTGKCTLYHIVQSKPPSPHKCPPLIFDYPMIWSGSLAVHLDGFSV